MLDITQIDYRIQGYKKEKIQNNLGDITTVNFYRDYDDQTQQFSAIKVRETRWHNRNEMGIPTETTVLIEWFSSDEVTVRATKQLIKPLNSDDGLKVNEQSRARLINKAKVYTILPKAKRLTIFEYRYPLPYNKIVQSFQNSLF
jgi:hypothetical protein